MSAAAHSHPVLSVDALVGSKTFASSCQTPQTSQTSPRTCQSPKPQEKFRPMAIASLLNCDDETTPPAFTSLGLVKGQPLVRCPNASPPFSPHNDATNDRDLLSPLAHGHHADTFDSLSIRNSSPPALSPATLPSPAVCPWDLEDRGVSERDDDDHHTHRSDTTSNSNDEDDSEDDETAQRQRRQRQQQQQQHRRRHSDSSTDLSSASTRQDRKRRSTSLMDEGATDDSSAARPCKPKRRRANAEQLAALNK
ncbi:hypothetical protein HK104_007833, partial [Borealophlyctis nickersoniae]